MIKEIFFLFFLILNRTNILLIMFIEPNFGKITGKDTNYSGWIEVICGSMFSGKTEELIRRLNRALIANQNVEIFKPDTDTRYHKENVVSHDKKSIRSTPVQFADDILLLSSGCNVIGIDEAQFFDKNIVSVARKLANSGKRVIIAGLDMDYMANPFHPMSDLLSIADFITKMHAICMKCGSIAGYSYRKAHLKGKVMLGEKDIYEARCRKCYFEDMSKRHDEL